ncbi:M28 family peptidase [Odoribacter sp. OttesenSCG-928-L07]|nr:M28 family peptidase [Odoribacter sp. OttesenSCG-928-L07]MDL2239700.1 M28 family peptidase [Bacteroidales bacterium OttesenSCG-928-L14]MDL2240809.1 M28 family peptidase [Bacteroidales bacterium OttesenSCG-928-K22]
MKIKKYICPIILVLVCFSSCKEGKQHQNITQNQETTKHHFVSNFNEDSAYLFVKQQVDFGPRVPGTKAHEEAAEYLLGKLLKYADTAIIQSFKARVYTGEIFDSKNIIGVFNPTNRKRILLCAHWDSRPYADHDPNPENKFTPIDGANDGASGVGVILEIARQLSILKPEIGVDIIFFDMEDYGTHKSKEDETTTGEEWALGSQYWAKNPHTYGYKAFYGILLDMVGAENPVFLKEEYSMHFAPHVIENIWKTASNLGYKKYFPEEVGVPINDDHFYINYYAKIPTVNIIHLDTSTLNGSFFEHWHTVEDNISKIDPKSLKVVGDVVLTVVMNE